jgi:hypothetical protein
VNTAQPPSGCVPDPQRFAEACRRFDELNAQDPNSEVWNGPPWPRELLFARRLTEWVERLAPNASEPLRLAARCQHLRRWTIPREQYPMTRTGYHQWRTTLKQFHADQSAEVLRTVGYDEPTIQRVRDLNLKRHLTSDPEMQVLEDALCLVFLQWQFAELARKTDEEKTINALRKSWQKMSPAGREQALKLEFGPHERRLLERALANPSDPGPGMVS